MLNNEQQLPIDRVINPMIFIILIYCEEERSTNLGFGSNEDCELK